MNETDIGSTEQNGTQVRRRLAHRALRLFAGAAFLCGGVVGILELGRARARSQALYRLDTVGLQAEGDLEYHAQESRRAFLYALGEHDPNKQLSSVEAARSEADLVDRAAGKLGTPDSTAGMRQAVNDFRESWQAYGRARDEIVALILQDETAEAINLDRTGGQQAFLDAVGHLHKLKARLGEHARLQSAAVDRTLLGCLAGLALFLVSTIGIVVALLRSNGQREAANVKLRIAREQDHQRSEILEMVGRHERLPAILSATVRLSCLAGPLSAAAIWAEGENGLTLQATSGFPPPLTDSLGWQDSLSGAAGPAGTEESIRRLCVAMEQSGYAARTLPLRDAAGALAGTMLLAQSAGAEFPADRDLAGISQLAGVAIESARQYEKLSFQAQHDILTGLPNRMLFQDRLDKALRLARRQKKKVSVIWVDLDRFKQINDTLGHLVGDQLLCEVARRLTGCVRDSDTVARFGGDEFTVLSADLDDTHATDALARRINAAIAAPMALLEHSVKVTASLGISMFPDHGQDPGTLLRNADLAMYRAKEGGRNDAQVFQPDFGDSHERRMLIERELTLALERGEFRLDYQPLVAGGNRIEAVEALLRWNNAELGKVSPAEFIPVAEDMRLIESIGEWVLRSAVAQAASWLASGLDAPRVAVNASAIQFTHEDFAPLVQRILVAAGLPAKYLEIEVTETVFVSNPEATTRQIDRLRDIGVKFSIDDFGTGYSSLNQLGTLPVDTVKIDRSFINEMDSSGGNSLTLVRGIINLAHSLQLRVVAEGVETQAQLNALWSMGCDLHQGFFLHKPMSPEKLASLLAPAAADESQVQPLVPLLVG